MSEAIVGTVVSTTSKFEVRPLWSAGGIVQEIAIRLKEPFDFKQCERVVIFVEKNQSVKLEEMTKFQILQG